MGEPSPAATIFFSTEEHQNNLASDALHMEYKDRISRLIADAPFEINADWQARGRAPTMASSAFLTNKQQGDWAEQLVLEAINNSSPEHIAIKYGRSDDLAAGDPGFDEFYASYQDELNRIGKAPDILVFKRGSGLPNDTNEPDEAVRKSAIAAIEVRSSSFLANKYARFMNNRTREAELECESLCKRVLTEPFASLLKSKNSTLYGLLTVATSDTFKELDFRAVRWSSSPELEELSSLLKLLKKQIKLLHRRDYLSITPKLEDLAVVNRWIQNYGIPHYYLQVFFDKAYLIAFEDILKIASDSEKEGTIFSIERDVRNQHKTTIKVNVQVGQELIGRIDMPEHSSELKELERGRLLYYVTFSGGRGYMDSNIFHREIVERAG